MKKLILFLAFCVAIFGQSTNTINIIPNATGAAVGTINFWDVTQAFSIPVGVAPLGSGIQLVTDGAAGFNGPVQINNTLKIGNGTIGSLSDFFAFENSTAHVLAVVDSSANTAFEFNDVTGISTAVFGVQASIIPLAAATYDLGSSGLPWRNLYISGAPNGAHIQSVGIGDSPTFGSLHVTGTATMNGTFGTSSVTNLSITGTAGVMSGGAFDLLSGSTLSLDGAIAGAHGQPIGTGDSPIFSSASIGTVFASSGGLTVNSLYGITSAGAVTGTSFTVGSTAGVSCSGLPTVLFASINGIVTHC